MLDCRLSTELSAEYTSPLDLTTVSAPLQRIYRKVLSNGTGANQADKLWHDRRLIAASGTDDLDLAGTLVDAFGATVTFARIKYLKIAALDTNVNNLIVGNATSNGFIAWVGGAAHTVTVRPGGWLELVATDATAYPVTAGTADLLRVANSGGGTSVTYDVILIGASA